MKINNKDIEALSGRDQLIMKMARIKSGFLRMGLQTYMPTFLVMNKEYHEEDRSRIESVWGLKSADEKIINAFESTLDKLKNS